MTAVKEDEILKVNPCRIAAADQERAAERPVLALEQVIALADGVPSRYRALVLVTTFASLRWGEVSALHRRDIDTSRSTVSVRLAFTEQKGVGLVLGPPKSKAGVRTVTLPRSIMQALERHLDEFVPAGADALVFTTENGLPIWRGNLNKLLDWKKCVTVLGCTSTTCATPATCSRLKLELR